MTSLRLNRRSKIAWAFALVFAVALAAWFWPDEDDNAVSIEFAGAGASDPDVVSFTITNRSRTRFGLKLGTLTFPSNGHWEELDIHLPNPNVLPGHSSVTCSDRIYHPYGPTHRWRLAVGFYVATVDSPIHRARWHLRESVHRLGWEQAGEWILPTIPRWRYAYGPEMVGNKPATF